MATVIGSLCFAVNAHTWEKGHVQIEPSFKTEEMWDSNVFYEPSNEKDDFITLLTPGLKGAFAFGAEGKHKITANYLCELGIFAQYDDENYGNHDFKAGVDLDFDTYTLNVNNKFDFTSSRAGTEFESRTLRKEDRLDTVFGVHCNKFDFDFGHEFFIVDYLSDTLKSINRYENSVWTTGYVEVMPKTKALAEFTYQNIVYPDTDQRDGDAYKTMLGLQGDLTAKLTGIIKGGYKVKTYRESTREDFSNAVAYVALLYSMTDNLGLNLSYNREPFESIYDNNNYYTGDHFTAALNYIFAKNWKAILDTMYFHNAYPAIATGESKKRTDNEWALGGRLEYAWKEWLVSGVGYHFHQRLSTISSREYDQHVINGDIKVKF
ncbi:hypothetical protein OMAG_001395 [Candidatus Omnitrophus magneticus]|uniref:Uncharacterized protein n=1 Tax=Candidatus Omnitrophus magneticus TaxID=1609969 RepID=A0A0F0CRX8_9BACT|nr:hypothetical protein OMAG_001395 [Candidatus Omnitrophus magneticus]